MRRATAVAKYGADVAVISIHALLAESDNADIAAELYCSISIHALLAESDTQKFKSIDDITISIHALLAESDEEHLQLVKSDVISIHALLAESDAAESPKKAVTSDFYPRSPCGERLYYYNRADGKLKFLSTLSLRRATQQTAPIIWVQGISIHALLAESDVLRGIVTPNRAHFYPRSPCGERPALDVAVYQTAIISIHALLAESDYAVQIVCVSGVISIHALLAESDPKILRHCTTYLFLSTLSLRRATSLNLPSSPILRFLSTLSLRRATNGHGKALDRV